MKLFKWNTSNLKPKFYNLVESFFGRNINNDLKENEAVSTVPSVNIADEDKAFELKLAIPGIDKKDLKIEVDRNHLIISSEKQYSKEENDKNWIRKEYGYASFQRIFQLPEGVDEDKVHAELKQGVLNIKIGKQKAFQKNKKKIELK